MVLIVEDELSAARTLMRLLPGDLTRQAATSAAAATSMLREHANWALLLIDVELGTGGSGLDVLDFAIAEHPAVARALVTGNESAYVTNYARTRSTDVIRKPFGREALGPTLARVVSSRAAPGELAAYLATLAVRVGFSDREHETLARLVAGEKREDLPRVMRVAASAVDTYVAGVVRKMRARDIHEVVEDVLRIVLLVKMPERPYR